ncbi:MAG: hypothetical protein ABSC94_15095 [Polyangiaceae bacterium]|jgi:hypothetical protein
MSADTTLRGLGRLLGLPAAAAFCGGCSLLFHADIEQCSTNADCTARGGSFENTVCQSGTCVLQPPVIEAGIDSGSGNSGIDASMGADAADGSGGADGADAMGDGGVDAPTCTFASDCPTTDPNYPQVACDPDTHACVQLTTAECPLVVGDYQEIAHVHPTFLGAFATMPESAPTNHPSYMNYDLAISEFGSAGGIPLGSNGALRMPVAVLCNDQANVDTVMSHLVNDVHITSLVAALDSATLKTTFGNYGFGTSAGLFFVNPFGADSTLTALDRGAQLWHMLGTPNDNAPAYAAVLPRIEQYVRNSAPWNLGPLPARMRVATVVGNATVLNDLASAVEPVLTWNNGETVATEDTAGGDYDGEVITISSLNGTDVTTYDYDSVVNDLLAFEPHVVISFGSEEFLQVLQRLDLEWTTSNGPLPFYLVGPYNAGSPTLINWVGVDSPPAESRRTRVAGINVASTTDTSVLDVYEKDFTAAQNPSTDLGAENYYDAMYFAVDSLVGAGAVNLPLTGADVGMGMQRLITASGAPEDMGPSDMGTIFTTLTQNSGSTIRLDGTLGPPYFNSATGARVGAGDVYCLERVVGTVPSFDYDVLRVTTNIDGGAPFLGGTFPCYPGF